MLWSNLAHFSVAAVSTVALLFGQPRTPTPTPSPTSLFSPPEQQTVNPTVNPVSRYKIACNLTSPEDLQIKEGDRVIAGQTVCDRTMERERLEAKKAQLEVAMEQMTLPLSPIAELPPPNFALEEQAIEAATAQLQSFDYAYIPESQFHPELEFLSKLHEPKIWEAKAQLQQEKLKAAIAVSTATAQLEKARADYQQRQYEHSLNLVRHQTEMQRQQFQLASLASELEQVEAKLNDITSVRSPYAATVRRVRILGQSDRTIQTEIFLDVQNEEIVSPAE